MSLSSIVPRAQVLSESTSCSQRISGNGSATCFGDADITYPVASCNSPPVDERCVARWLRRFSSSIELLRSWLTGHQAGDPPNDSDTSGHFDSTASLPTSRNRHHRSYAPYPIPSTYAFNTLRWAMRLLSYMDYQQLNRRPSLFPFRRPPREAVYAEVGTDMSHLS